MVSVEEKINRVGAISDGLIKHGIAKLKDVLGSALITTKTTKTTTTTTTTGLKKNMQNDHPVAPVILERKSKVKEYFEINKKDSEDGNICENVVEVECGEMDDSCGDVDSLSVDFVSAKENHQVIPKTKQQED
jgi:hypothetical protein